MSVADSEETKIRKDPNTNMPCQVDFEPIGRRALCEPGLTILEIARRAGVQLAAVCGGVGTCGQCKVQIREGKVSTLSGTEIEVLSASEIENGYRLACQAVALSSLKIHVPARSLTATQRIQVESLAVEVAVDPLVAGYALDLAPPTKEDIRSDAGRVADALRQRYGIELSAIDFNTAQIMSNRLRENHWSGIAVLRQSELIDWAPRAQRQLGFASDLGTTKMAGYLLDLKTGQLLASRGVMNPQIAYGEDVMARISYAMENPEKAETLARVVREAFDGMIGEMCAEVDTTPQAVTDAVIVGNTAMHHLFAGLPVRQLGLAPYVAAVSAAMDVKARDLGLHLAPGAYVHLLPNIAGFVGADHVAMLLATGIYKDNRVVAGLDIGTNTEVALWANGRLLTCSTASGPAFEGAHIRDGMRAAEGAIERILLDDEQIVYQTIGDVAPIGICGSGILDAVAQLFKHGVVDRRGAIKPGHPRVRETANGREFVLVEKEDSSAGREIIVTRGDIGEIQLAKGAMRAGLNILLEKAGISESDIDAVVIAGAFGSYIDVASAVAIGMFPTLPLDRFVQVGNAAGMGARMALVSQEQREEAKRIAAEAEYVELTNTPEFTEAFALAMYLN